MGRRALTTPDEVTPFPFRCSFAARALAYLSRVSVCALCAEARERAARIVVRCVHAGPTAGYGGRRAVCDCTRVAADAADDDDDLPCRRGRRTCAAASRACDSAAYFLASTHSSPVCLTNTPRVGRRVVRGGCPSLVLRLG